MPRMIVEVSKADHNRIYARARHEGVSLTVLASWLLREKLDEDATREAAESAEPEPAVA